MRTEAATDRPGSPAQLFYAFTWLALQGFGGVLAVAQRVLCEERRWLAREQFIEMLAIAQVLPGPNICNLALMVGDRFFGWRGAFAALAGMMTVPLVIVLALTAGYAHFSGVPEVSGALRGMGAVSAGLIAGTALKLLPSLRTSVLGVHAAAAFAVTAFVAVGLLRWPLVWVLAALGGTSWSLAWVRLHAQRRAGDDARG